MVITTAYDPREPHIHRAKQLALQLNARFVERKKDSIATLKRKYNTNLVIVVKHNEARCFIGEEQFFFHPSTAEFRIKRLISGDNDVMVETCQLTEGDSILDCTLGLGSDAIVAAHAVGDAGKVVGLESEYFLATIVKEGLKHRISQTDEVNKAMRRVIVENSNHLTFLKNCKEDEFDVVYFDPMFRDKVEDAAAMDQFRTLTNPSALSIESIKEALRVAKRRVVLKERSDSGEFERLGFQPVYRQSASTTFGIIECTGEGTDE